MLSFTSGSWSDVVFPVSACRGPAGRAPPRSGKRRRPRGVSVRPLLWGCGLSYRHGLKFPADSAHVSKWPRNVTRWNRPRPATVPTLTSQSPQPAADPRASRDTRSRPSFRPHQQPRHRSTAADSVTVVHRPSLITEPADLTVGGLTPSAHRTQSIQFAPDPVPQHVMLRPQPEPVVTPPVSRIQPHRPAHQLSRLPLEPRPDMGMQERVCSPESPS